MKELIIAVLGLITFLAIRVAWSYLVCMLISYVGFVALIITFNGVLYVELMGIVFLLSAACAWWADNLLHKVCNRFNVTTTDERVEKVKSSYWTWKG